VTSPTRAVPFFCPYCGEEDLRPHDASHGSWWCASCRRAWTLKYLGTGTPAVDAAAVDVAADEPESGSVSS